VLFIARTANIFAVRQSRLMAKKKPWQTAAALTMVRLRHVAPFAVRRVFIMHGKVLKNSL
jgi:hypothetical protein